MTKNVVINAALILASTLIALLLGELLYRSYVVIATQKKIYEPSADITYYHDKMNVYDREHGFSYNPDTVEYALQIRDHKATFCQQVLYINPFGTFEKDASDFKRALNEAKKTGPRILVFGASFTTIPHDGETWVSQFSRKFKEKIDPRGEVLAFGRDGYNIAQMLILAADTIPKWKPDMVLIAFTAADLRNGRFWRNSFETGGRGYTYVVHHPDGNETSVDAKIALFYDNRITKEWCEKVMGNGGEDPEIEPMIRFYENARKAELGKNAPDFFAPESFLYNRIVHGQAVFRPPSYKVQIGLQLRDDPEVKAAIQKLNDSKIPYYFVHFPLIEEMKNNARWQLTVENQRIIKDLTAMSGTKQILFLGDYMHLNKEQLGLFPVSEQDGHPSKDGIVYIAESMINLYKNKDVPKAQRDVWLDGKQEALTRQINQSPMLDAPSGWGFQYAKAKDPNGPGVIVGPRFNNVFAQQFRAQENDQFKIIARASLPKAKWGIFGAQKHNVMGRFQINWANAKGEYIDTYLEPFEVTSEEKTYETYVVAPTGAAIGTLYVSPNGDSDAVHYTEMSLLGKQSR